MISLLAIPLLLIQQSNRLTLEESFEGVGQDWSTTQLSDIHTSGQSAFTSEAITADQGAPNTNPALPINVGGDLEGRFSEVQAPAGNSFALTPNSSTNSHADASIQSLMAFGVVSSFGNQSIGLLLRASVNPAPPFGSGLNAYTAYISRGGQDARLTIARWRDGVITVSDVYACATFDYDPSVENYKLRFDATGSLLTATLSRVTSDPTGIKTTPVVFTSGVGVNGNQLSAIDLELTLGREGVTSFTRSLNSTYWDDIRVRPRLTQQRPFGFMTYPAKLASSMQRRVEILKAGIFPIGLK